MLISALHKFVTYLLTHLPTYLHRGTPQGLFLRKTVNVNTEKW